MVYKHSEPFYRNIYNEEEVFMYAYKNKLPLMLKGPTGCGKSRFVEKMAFKLNQHLIQVACNEETSSVDLIGRYIVYGGDTIWQDGPLTKAVRTDSILYLDEISEAREDIVVALHPISDYRRTLYIDRTCEILNASSKFMIVISFNPGYQKSFKELKPSTRQRFISLQFNYPSVDLEIEILNIETDIDINIARLLVLYAQKIRNLKELELIETVSTRLLVNAALLIKNGLNIKRSCEVAIIYPLTDDLDIQESLIDIANLVFE